MGSINAQNASRLINPADCKGYCNDTNFETCPDANGICCLAEIVVDANFNSQQFDNLVIAKNDAKLRDLLSKDLAEIGLKNFLKLKSANAILSAIKNNTVVLRKLKSTKKANHYMLVLTKSLTSKKLEYWGHVTLLR